MKKPYILSVVAIVIFCFTGVAFSGSRNNDSRHGNRNNPQQYQKSHRNEKERIDHRGYRDDKRHRTYRHNDHDRRYEYRKHHGYSEHPYQKHRRYSHYVHKGHRYGYQGHWRSWDQWHRYAKGHPKIYKHGSYYREGGHLMFRFRDPVSGSFFFFSIGH
ncbi:MAG: hypothetical protein P8X96_06370 [Desulfobacteraceae bacterium]